MRVLGRHQNITRYRRHQSIEDKIDMIRRLGGKCASCGSTESIEIHHKILLANGGNDNIKNCVLLCKKCHKKTHKEPPRP